MSHVPQVSCEIWKGDYFKGQFFCNLSLHCLSSQCMEWLCNTNYLFILSQGYQVKWQRLGLGLMLVIWGLGLECVYFVSFHSQIYDVSTVRWVLHIMGTSCPNQEYFSTTRMIVSRFIWDMLNTKFNECPDQHTDLVFQIKV